MSKFGHVGFQLTILCMKYKSFSLSPWQIAKKACPPTTCGRAYHHRKSPTYNLWPGVPSQEIHDLIIMETQPIHTGTAIYCNFASLGISKYFFNGLFSQ